MRKINLRELVTWKNIKTGLMMFGVVAMLMIVPSMMAYGMFVFSYFLGQLGTPIFSPSPFPTFETFNGAIGGTVCLILFLMAIKADIKFGEKEKKE